MFFEAHTSAARNTAIYETPRALTVLYVYICVCTTLVWRKAAEGVLGANMIPAAPPLVCVRSSCSNEEGRSLPHRYSHLPRNSLGLALSHAFRPYFNA